MSDDTLNRLHELRFFSQDLRLRMEKDRVWPVVVHLSACENELTAAIAKVNERENDAAKNSPN